MQKLLISIPFFIFAGIAPLFSQSFNRNYIKTNLIKEAGLTKANVGTAINNIKKQTHISYFDGLGRETQNILVQGSPSYNDIVKFHEYDLAGRETQVWLPLTRSDNYNPGDFCPDAKNKTRDFYGDNNPFSDIVYDNSALNRIIEKIPEGKLYRNRNKSVKIKYLTNDANEIIKWKVVNDQCVKDGNGYFSEGSLRLTEITDENGNKTREYSNISGQVIVKAAKLNNTWIKTYYVFDDFGLLRFVIPPQAAFEIEANNASFQNLAQIYCYAYKYDKKKRLIEKKLPGAAPVYTVYDKRDLPVAVQDGNMREKNLWMFTKYDVFKRPVIKGVIETNANLPDMQATLDNFYRQNTTCWEEKCSSGYTNQAYPDTAQSNLIDIYSIIWYDDYAHPSCNADYIAYPQINSEYDSTRSFKGLTTFTLTKILNTNQYIKTSLFYDEYNREIQSQTTNPQNVPGQLHYLDIISNEYDFTGKITKTLQDHKSESTASFSMNDIPRLNIKILNEFSYDHADRILQSKETLYEDEQIISSIVTQANEYNERGELEKKRLHQSRGNCLQEQTFRYNLRGWLTSINDPENLGDSLFALQLLYENASRPQYNGNISSMIWNTRQKNRSQYNFRYDALNRLKKARYLPDGRYDTRYSYDLNGNITQLKRNGMVQKINNPGIFEKKNIDNLRYHYSGNQLLRIKDKPSSVYQSYGFSDKGSSGDRYIIEYVYDANGNMTSDDNKGIKQIEYNLLNLPRRIFFKKNEAIHYVYDASGIKLVKEIYKDGGIKRFDYLGNFVYEDNTLKYIITDYGKITVNNEQYAQISSNDTYTRHYDLKDHLGNVRASFSAKDDNTLELLQEDSYYPFGMQQSAMSYLSGSSEQRNFHLYNGKELQTDFDLDWYDYGARFYDPQLGRFHTVDPHAERYPAWSPYNFVYNNPLIFIDPDGRDPILIVFTGGVSGDGKLQTNFNSLGTAGKIAQSGVDANSTVKAGVFAPGYRDKDAVSNAYNFLTKNHSKGDKIVIYGYSHGGVAAENLTEKLKAGGYDVDLLITVDAAYGPVSGSLDRDISDNVGINVNEYQTTNSPIGSRGDKNSGSSSTQIFNINVGDLVDDVTHGNIDEATYDYNSSLIKTIFSGKRQKGEIKSTNYNPSSSRSSTEGSSSSSSGSSSSSSFDESSFSN